MLSKTLLFAAGAALLAPLSAYAQITNGHFETGNLSGWTLFGQGQALDASFGISPTEGSYFGFIDNTGNFTQTAPDIVAALNVIPSQVGAITTGPPTRGTALYQDITVAAGDSMHFDFNFITTEMDQDPSFDDFAFFSIVSPSFSQIYLMASRDNGAIDPSQFSPAPYNGATGWQSEDYTFAAADTYRVGFVVLNVKDAGHDSALLLDNIFITQTPEPASAGALAISSILCLARRRHRI